MKPTLPSTDPVPPTVSVRDHADPGVGSDMDIPMSFSGAVGDEATGRQAVELLATGVRIVVWTFANLTLLLGAWVVLGSVLAGWSPVVITSDSMRPTLDAGDVILVSEDSQIGQRDVIVFDRGDTLIAHRVFAVEGEQLITKGDANSTPDSAPVDRADVVGSGRLVIPFAGLPLVWAQTGDWIPFTGWALLTGAGIIGTALALDRALRRNKRREDDSAEFAVARVGIQRVRVLTAVLLLGQVVISSDGSWNLAARNTFLSLAAVGVLIATNFLGSVRTRRNQSGGRSAAILELVIDTVLVVLLTTSTESGLSWILFALPIIEAAVRFRLVGALVHWMGLTGLTLTLDLLAGESRSSAEVVSGLESRLDQLGVLFLFVIPASYLAEQLLGEVTTWQRATGQARRRSELLARVADVGRDISRLDGGHVSTILAGLTSMGFDRADMVARDGSGTWQVASNSGLPAAGTAASCTRDVDLGRRASIVTVDDQDGAEVRALDEAGLAMVISQVISDHNGRLLVLRAGVDVGKELGSDHLEAFRLLAGQATVALQNADLMTEVTSMHDELEHRALHDSLTGLPNRVLLLRHLRQERTSGREVAVLFLDLNGFKPVNDRLGHDVGDVLLAQVARRLESTIPRSALVARLGGDEFTVVHSAADRDGTMDLASKIVEVIRTPFEIGDQMIHISTSVGVAYGSYDTDDSELVRRADVAMYEAKHGSLSESVEMYRPDLDLRADRRARLSADIAEAIADGTLHLTYQPFVDTETERIVGAEALLRWDHPTFGRVPPEETIDAAVASSMSAELNRHIVRSATVWVSEAQAATGDTTLFVAVNASPEELTTPGLARNIAQAIELADIDASALAVEISERIVTPVSQTAQRNMEDLQAMGVRLLLDDFGEGSTSLSYLQELPVSGVKLDRRLVVNAARSRTDRLVLESIARLSADIGLSVIAEGIETEDHLDAVTVAGCSLVQGYHLFRPMSGDELTGVLCDPDQMARERSKARSGPAVPRPAQVAEAAETESETEVEAEKEAEATAEIEFDLGLIGDEGWTRPLFAPTPDLDARSSESAIERPDVEPDPDRPRSKSRRTTRTTP